MNTVPRTRAQVSPLRRPRQKSLFSLLTLLLLLLSGASWAQQKIRPIDDPPPDPDPEYTQTVLQVGDGWQLVQTDGVIEVGRVPYSERVYMIDGVRYTWSERFLFGAITLDLFAVLLAGATAMLPVYARDILQVGPDGLGQLRAAPAVGASFMALMFTFRPLRHNVGSKMLWAVVVFGLATIGFGFSHEIGARVFGNAEIDALNMGAGMAVALTMLVLLGASDMLSVYVRSSLVQLNTPDDMRGRVSSVSGLAISASNELGELQSGVAAALLGPVGAVVFGGFGAIMVTGLWAWLFPELKNARTFEPQYRGKSP
mgnify:CR=1 FL=1